MYNRKSAKMLSFTFPPTFSPANISRYTVNSNFLGSFYYLDKSRALVNFLLGNIVQMKLKGILAFFAISLLLSWKFCCSGFENKYGGCPWCFRHVTSDSKLKCFFLCCLWVFWV